MKYAPKQTVMGLPEALGIDAHAWSRAVNEAERGNPDWALSAIADAEKSLEELKLYVIRHARTRRGLPRLSWEQIGHRLGVSKQAVQKKYSHRIER